jgi:hypothetical protein
MCMPYVERRSHLKAEADIRRTPWMYILFGADYPTASGFCGEPGTGDGMFKASWERGRS